MNEHENVAALRERLQALVDDLRAASAGGRCTLRYDAPERGWDVEDVVVEALAPGVKPLKGVRAINQRATNGVLWMAEHRRCLFQPDLNAADPPAPPALREVYQATAQMLAPLFDARGHLRGWISLHWTDGPRDITDADRRHLEAARKTATEILDSATPAPAADRPG